jgi:hypothetical protein
MRSLEDPSPAERHAAGRADREERGGVGICRRARDRCRDLIDRSRNVACCEIGTELSFLERARLGVLLCLGTHDERARYRGHGEQNEKTG